MGNFDLKILVESYCKNLLILKFDKKAEVRMMHKTEIHIFCIIRVATFFSNLKNSYIFLIPSNSKVFSKLFRSSTTLIKFFK